MNCKRCGRANPQSARFCMQCGQPLELACPGCGGVLPPDAAFCIHCGRRVHVAAGGAEAGPGADSGPDEGAGAGERRNVTVVFSDLVGYTALNEQLDPEEVASIMDRVKVESVAIIERHGGIVNQFVGDEVLALFGIPTAHEDDPPQAVRAVQALHTFVDGVGDEVRERVGQGLRMHTGINTGLVVFSLRDPRSGSYSITGDAVNTAARLKSQAVAGEVLVSPETQRLIAPYFQTEALPPVEMKGKAQPVTPFRVLAASQVRSRFEAAAQHGLSPHVGSSTELQRLQPALEALLEGRGQLVTVCGDAGLGKSRLIWEFRRGLAGHSVTVLEGGCQALGAETPYLPFIEAMRRGWGLTRADSPAQLRAKVLAQVQAREGLAAHLPFYLNLLSLPDPEYPLPPHLAGQELAGAYAEAVAAWTLQGPTDQPHVVLLEDWHWADEASRGVLAALVPRLASAPSMVVVSYRPELEVDWGRHDHHLHVQLRPLVERDSAALLRGVLGAEALPAGLAERIHERTGGNPLFIEEMARALQDDGALQVREGRAELLHDLEALELPGSVQAVIRSRLDRLTRPDREILGLASVAGQRFSRSVLERLSSAPARLSASLDALLALDLIQQVRVVPEAVYAFKQLLTQQVAYETLLRERRRELHGLTGRAIEELQRERLNEQVELLVHHYSLAEEWGKAALYARRSGEKAHGLSQFQQAARFYEQGVEFLLHLPEEHENRLLKVDLQLEACFCYVNLGRFDEAIAAGEKIETDVEALGDPHRRVRLMVMFGTCYMYRGDRANCERYLFPALDLRELQGDALSLANCKHVLAGCYVGQGLWNLASPYLEEAVRIYEQEGVEDEYLYGYYVLPYVVGCAQLGLTWAFQGRVADAAELFRQTLPRAQGRVANFATKGVFFSWLSVFSALVGEDRLSIQPVVEVMVRKAESSDSPFLLLAGRVVQTNLLVALGRMEEARDLGRQAVEALAGLSIRTGHLANLYYNLILAEVLLGDLDAAREHLGEARPLAPLSPHWFGPRFDMLEGLLSSRSGASALALDYFARSVAGDLEAGAEVLADQTRYHQAVTLARTGEGGPAQQQLTDLERRFSVRGMATWQRLCARARAELEEGAPPAGRGARPAP